MNKYGWIIFSVAVVVLLGGLVVWARVANPPIDLSGVSNNSIVAASEQNGNIADHVKGPTDSKVVFIEYGDFQCPSCGAAHPNVNELLEEYGEDITFIFRNFPLTAIHPNALSAATVAEAAGLQGKYWDMYNLLFDNQDEWSQVDTSKRTTIFESYANELGLDIDKFNTDVAGTATSQKVKFDLALGKQANVSATPTFFLNGEQLDDTTANGIVNGNLDPIKEKFDELLGR